MTTPTSSLPASQRAMQAAAFAIDSLRLVERPVPRPRRGEILVRIEAASLNYRDLAILGGKYMPQLPMPYVPASDACGTVVEAGADVTRFKVGDRVVPLYTQGWHDGLPTLVQRTTSTLGAPLSGVLQEYVVVPAEDAVAPPPALSAAEAATLPIAAVTAWTTLQEGGVKPGSTVLLLGTGGVAIFALQFAKMAGARVIITSSSGEKLEHARALGADVCINYRSSPDWVPLVRQATDGRGVDIVAETGGATLAQSIACCALGGFVGVIGFVAGPEATIPVRTLLGPMVRVQGIATGSRARFEAMNRAIVANGLKPVIDSRFDLADSAAAFHHMAAGAHFGKIVVDVAKPAS